MPDDSPALSRREREVLEQLHFGLTNRQIAERLGISPNTVNKHVQKVLRKLGVGNRILAVMHSLGSARTSPDNTRHVMAIDKYRRLGLVESLRAARIAYAESLEIQGLSDEAKSQWRLAALAHLDAFDQLPESLRESAG